MAHIEAPASYASAPPMEMFTPAPIEPQLAPELSLDQIPLQFVPAPGERSFSAGEKFTAAHEANHALAAMLLVGPGVVDKISVQPDDWSLGRTIFRGFISLDKFKTIAAAGAVPTPFGSAEGFSHDLFQVAQINRSNTGVFWEVENAKRALAQIPAKVKEKMAEIIAHLKVVSGSILPEILARAYLEADLEGKGQLYMLSHALRGKFTPYEKPAAKLPKEHTRIEYIDKHIYRYIYVKDGQEKTTIICGACGGENVHAQNCPAVKYQRSGANLAISLEIIPPRPIASEPPLSPSGTIFSLS